MIFCLKLNISITTKLIGFSILGKLHIGLVRFNVFDLSLGKVLSYLFIPSLFFEYKPLDG